jgi:hypothetical protein
VQSQCSDAFALSIDAHADGRAERDLKKLQYNILERRAHPTSQISRTPLWGRVKI